MSALKAFQHSSSDLALGLLKSGATTLQQYESTYKQHFPSQPLSVVQEVYANSADLTQNASLMATVNRTVELCDSVMNCLEVLERYVTLSIPKMEDGNNFGVTIQLAALKSMGETHEKLVKAIDELSKYPKERADALEKCKQLPSNNTVTTMTTSQSDSSGNNTEKGDVKSNETKKAQEEKKTSTVVESPELALRQQAVINVDVLFYVKAKATFNTALTGYMSALDMLDKNKDKIAQPKGSESGRSAYSSMY